MFFSVKLTLPKLGMLLWKLPALCSVLRTHGFSGLVCVPAWIWFVVILLNYRPIHLLVAIIVIEPRTFPITANRLTEKHEATECWNTFILKTLFLSLVTMSYMYSVIWLSYQHFINRESEFRLLYYDVVSYVKPSFLQNFSYIAAPIFVCRIESLHSP